MRAVVTIFLACCALPSVASADLTWTAHDAQISGVTAGAVRQLSLDAVSCASPGNCAAVGSYDAATGPADVEGLLISQAGGQWQTGVRATLPAGAAANPQVRLNSVSCASAGNCTAVGHYVTSAGAQQGLVLTETGGTWGAGTTAALPGDAATNPVAELSSVDCTSAGNCVAVGRYSSNSGTFALVLTQAAGVPGTGAVAATSPSALLSVSCASAGNCTAVGFAHSAPVRRGILVTQSSGVWGAAAEIPVGESIAGDAVSYGVSCAGASNCGAIGVDHVDPTLLPAGCGGATGPGCESGVFGELTTQTPGGVTNVKTQPAAGSQYDQFTWVFDVSCPSAGECTAVGAYVDGQSGNVDTDSDGLLDTGPGEIFTQAGGSWGAGAVNTDTAGTTVRNLRSVSCVSAAICAATGDTRDAFGAFHGGWLLTRQAGTWAAATRAPVPANTTPVGGPLLSDISCTSESDCAAVGSFADADSVHHGWLLSAAPVSDTVVNPPTNPNPGTTAQQDSTPTTPSTPTATPAVSADAACAAGKLVLVDVFPQAGRMRALGVAPPGSAGKRVALVLQSTGKTVAAATVKPDLSFAASAPLPPARARRTARIKAKLGAISSGAVPLNRRLYLTSFTPAGTGSVRIAGFVTAPLASPPKPVVLRVAGSCADATKGVILGSAKPGRSGAFSGKFVLPRALASGPSVFLSASSKVPKRRGGKPTSTIVSRVRGLATS